MRLAAFGGVRHRLSFALALLGAACDRDTHARLDPTITPFASSDPPAAPAGASKTDASPTKASPVSRAFVPEREPETKPAETPAVDATLPEGTVVGGFIVDSLVDVAAAGPITASDAGVTLVNRKNELWLARLTRPLEKGDAPRETHVVALPDAAGPFPLGRGPALWRGFAYWISRSRLLRQRITSAGAGSVPQVLAEDARVGTRAAIPTGPEKFVTSLPDVVAYVVKQKTPEAPLTANLWIAGRSTPVTLTDDTASAHSVALAATARGVAALFLEARTGMSAIHLRLIHFSKESEPTLDPDQIVWVGGPSRSSTEFFAQGGDETYATGFMTLEQDATHFGLVQFQFALAPAQASIEPHWVLYPNGIEPAPVASANVCGRSVWVLARPTSAIPHAPQELVLFDRADASRSVVVARSKAFFDVSIASLGRGALIAYVADHRTWARAVRCVGS